MRSPCSGTAWWKTLANAMTPERLRFIEGIQARQLDKKQAFARAAMWLSSLAERPKSPATDADWAALAETMFWLGRLSTRRGQPVTDWISEAELDRAIGILPLEILADLVMGLASAGEVVFVSWLVARRDMLLARFRQGTQTVVLEDDDEKVTAHFVLEFERLGDKRRNDGTSVPDEAKDYLHEETIRRIGLLRRLLPDRSTFACQGYGHRIWPDGLPHDYDSTQKTGVPRAMLPPLWLTGMNAIFYRLARHPWRTSTWPEYTEAVVKLRLTVLRELQQLERALETYFRRPTAVEIFGADRPIDAEAWQHCWRALRRPPLLPTCALDEWGFVDEFSSGPVDGEARDHALRVTVRGLVLHRYKSFLTPFGEYSRALSNFFEQAVHAMILNPALAKGKVVATQEGRTKLLELATEQGLKTDGLHLSPINLADAVKSLPAMQRECRALLAQFLDLGEVERLEHQESRVFTRVWAMWYWFVSHPRQILPNATQECPRRLTELLRRVRKALRRELAGYSTDSVQFAIASESAHWADQPAIWLTIDCTDPAAVYGAVDNAIGAIRNAVNTVEASDLRRFVLDFFWPFVVIVPLVRGKLMEATAWRIFLPTLLNAGEGGINWVNFIRQPIPQGALEELALSVWPLPRLEVAATLLDATETLLLLAGHLRDLNRLPEVDEQAFEYLQDYIHHLSDQIGAVFQTAIDTAVRIVDAYNQLPEPERARWPKLAAAAGSVRELYEIITSGASIDGGRGLRLVVTLPESDTWVNRLKEVREAALRISLLWSNDCLDEIAV